MQTPSLISAGRFVLRVGTVFFVSVFTHILPLPAFGQDPLSEFARSRPWLRLLQYRSDDLPSRSVARNPEFFAASDGNRDPVAEAKALVKMFEDPLKLHPTAKEPWACVFPARYVVLKHALKAPWPTPTCKEFDEWRGRLPHERISLVFSSAYKGNPASIFGHTFLVLGESTNPSDPRPQELLGYAIAFLADTQGDNNPITYTWNGLFGGFIGRFDTMTYYETVNTYNNAESRDLWEYDLNLSPAQRELLIAHLWEVSRVGLFRYWFFDENCSWHVLGLLEAAAPEWHLKDQTSSLWTIPSETVRTLKKIPDATTHIRFRPSQRKRMETALSSLTEEQLEIMEDLSRGDRMNPTPPIEVWDAAISWQMYRQQNEAADFPDEDKQQFRQLLVDRARIATPANILVFDDVSRRNQPDLGHGVHAISLGASRDRQANTSAVIRFTTGLSDLLANDLGFEPDSEVKYFDLGLRWDANKRMARITDSTIIQIQSLAPWSPYDPRWAWRIGGVLDEGILCEQCTDATLHGGAGMSWGAANHWLAYTLLGGKTSVASTIGHHQPRLFVGFTGGIRLVGRDRFTLLAEGSALTQLLPSSPVIAQNEYVVGSEIHLTHAWALRLSGQITNTTLTKGGNVDHRNATVMLRRWW